MEEFARVSGEVLTPRIAEKIGEAMKREPVAVLADILDAFSVVVAVTPHSIRFLLLKVAEVLFVEDGVVRE